MWKRQVIKIVRGRDGEGQDPSHMTHTKGAGEKSIPAGRREKK